ncbi:MAG: dockerin type I domain-containing protein [Planctomycetota bacterium]
MPRFAHLNCIFAVALLGVCTALDASAQTADVLVSEGDQPIPTLVDASTSQPAFVDNIFGFNLAPTGEWVANLSFFLNELVEVAPGVSLPVGTQRNIYYGDTGSGPQLLLEDDTPVGGLLRASLGTPQVNAAGDLGYISFNNENPSNIGTITEGILINDTVLAAIGSAPPAGIGFQPGAQIVSGGTSVVELFEDGDAWVRIEATGLPANVVSSDAGDDGTAGTGVDEFIAHYDASTGTFTRVFGSGDTVTNENGPDLTIGISEIEVPGLDFDAGGVVQVRTNEARTIRVFKIDADIAEDSVVETLVYNDKIARFVGGENIQDGVVIPDRVGGDGVSQLSSIGNIGVSDGGAWVANVDLGSVALDDVVLVNGGVAVQQNDTVPVAANLGGGTFNLGGIFNGITMNADGDYAYVNNDAIVLNGEVVILEGTTTITGGDTLLDLFLSFDLSDRDQNGDVTILFNGERVNGVEELYEITLTPQDLLPGDFDYDRDTANAFGDVDDIDILGNFLDTHGFDSDAFDLTDDGLVDQSDITELVANIFGTSPGDANLDGKVDTSDLAILAASFGSSVTSWSFADFNGSDSVDTSDLAILAASFGADNTLGPATAAIPEPGALAIVALSALPALGRRRSPRV